MGGKKDRNTLSFNRALSLSGGDDWKSISRDDIGRPRVTSGPPRVRRLHHRSGKYVIVAQGGCSRPQGQGASVARGNDESSMGDGSVKISLWYLVFCFGRI